MLMHSRMHGLNPRMNAHAFQVYDGVRHEVLKHVDAFPRAVAALDKHWGV